MYNTMICLDPTLPPSQPWSAAYFAVAVSVDNDRFAAAVCRRDAMHATIVRTTTGPHDATTIMSRTWALCAAFAVFRVHSAADVDLGHPDLRLVYATPAAATRILAPASLPIDDDLVVQACELAGSTALRAPAPRPPLSVWEEQARRAAWERFRSQFW